MKNKLEVLDTRLHEIDDTQYNISFVRHLAWENGIYFESILLVC